MIMGIILEQVAKYFFQYVKKKAKGKNVFNLYHNNVNKLNILKVSVNRERKPNNPISKQNKKIQESKKKKHNNPNV